MTTAPLPPDTRSLKFLPLVDHAALDEFECGEGEIDRKIQVCCEWHKTHRAKVFCAHTEEIPRAYGFYSLSMAAPPSKDFDREIAIQNDERSFIPFIYVNYLAVRREYQNQKVGTMLLGNMLARCGEIVRHVGVFGVALNALTPRVVSLYEKYGFRQRNETKYPLMILPTQSLIDLTRDRRPV